MLYPEVAPALLQKLAHWAFKKCGAKRKRIKYKVVWLSDVAAALEGKSPMGRKRSYCSPCILSSEYETKDLKRGSPAIRL